MSSRTVCLASSQGDAFDHHNQFRAGGGRGSSGLGLPDVLADQIADANTVDDSNRASATGAEIAFVVEHTVVGQRLLVRDLHDLTVAQERRRVVHLALTVREADDGSQAIGIGGQVLHGLLASGEEAGVAAAGLPADNR